MQGVLSLCLTRSLTIKIIGSFQGGRGIERGEEGPVFSSVEPKKTGDFLPFWSGFKRPERQRKGRRSKGGADKVVVNQKELSQCLGISTRQIRNLKSEGLFQTETNSRGYSLEKCVQEYINFKINAEMGRRTNIKKEEVQAEHEEIKKQISVLKLRKLRRELHEASDVEAFLTDMLTSFRNRLLSLPPKLAMQLSGINDLNDMIKAIKTELENTLEELSQYDPDEIDGVNPGDIDADEQEEEEEEEE